MRERESVKRRHKQVLQEKKTISNKIMSDTLVKKKLLCHGDKRNMLCSNGYQRALYTGGRDLTLLNKKNKTLDKDNYFKE